MVAGDLLVDVGASTGVAVAMVGALVNGTRVGESRYQYSVLFFSIVYSVFSPGSPANIDRRLTDGSEQALVDSFRSIKINSNDLPLRPGFGKEGKQVKLRANFFPVKVPKASLYEYDVAISPTAGSANRRVKRRIFQLAEKTADWSRCGLQGTVAHDHSSKLIASKKLAEPIVIRVPYYDEDETHPGPNGKEYTLTITFIQNIDTSHLLK